MSSNPERARRLRTLARDESGSLLPMIIGYVAIALALIVVTSGATSLYLTQKRADAIADAAALAGADGFTLTIDGSTPSARLVNGDIWQQAAEVVAVSDPSAWVVSAYTDDGVTANVDVGIVWHPPLISWLLPDGLTLTASGSSRTALDSD